MDPYTSRLTLASWLSLVTRFLPSNGKKDRHQDTNYPSGQSRLVRNGGKGRGKHGGRGQEGPCAPGRPAAHARLRAPPPWRCRCPVSRGWRRRLPLRKSGLRLLPPTPPALRRRRRRRQRCLCLSATSTAASNPRPALLAGRGTVVVDARPCLREGEFPPGGGGGPSFSPQLPRPREGRAPRPAPPATWPTSRAGRGRRPSERLSPQSPSAPAAPRPRDVTCAWRGWRGSRGQGGQEKRRPSRGRGKWGGVSEESPVFKRPPPPQPPERAASVR